MSPSPEDLLALLALAACAVAGLLAVRKRGQDSLPRRRQETSPHRDSALLLDTSTLVDGRVVDLLELILDPRPVVVPAVVVEELEHLAGSREDGRRRRGLLGQQHLAVLAAREGSLVEEVSGLPARSERAHGLHLPGGVDEALLERCRSRREEILVTLDAGLAERARGEELPVLDLTRLAARLALRYRVGDVLRVTVEARGRRPGQGTATLDDGIRVLVEDAGDRVGETFSVCVSSISRTRGGRVLFANSVAAEPTLGVELD